MKWSELFTSSIGKKWVMALTGIFLILFLIIHVSLNACIWANDNGKMFNEGAEERMKSVMITNKEHKKGKKEKKGCC